MPRIQGGFCGYRSGLVKLDPFQVFLVILLSSFNSFELTVWFNKLIQTVDLNN